MASASAAALSALILCSMTLLALAARPLTHDIAPQGTMEQQAVPVLSSHNKPSVARRLLQHASARTLLASTATSDTDLDDRSKFVTRPLLQPAYKSLMEVNTDSAESIPLRRLLVSAHTSDRDLEDRSDTATNSALNAAVKRLEADTGEGADSLPFRRLLVSDHTSDSELEDRSAAVTNPLLLSAYKKFEADQAVDGGSNIEPFRKLLTAAAAAAAAAAVPGAAADQAADQPSTSH